MAAGDATAADVPGKYDVVINGKGYVFLDSLEPSIPFRTHRAIYGLTPPFVERQNVSNAYGDNAQDFFLTIRQRDWSLGEQQKFFRASQDGSYYAGSNVDVTIPGQVMLRKAVKTLSFAASVTLVSPFQTLGGGALEAVSSTHVYEINSTGAITDNGAHGLGVAPTAVANDSNSLFLSATAGGAVGVRRYSGTYTTFSATAADALGFLNNTLYGYNLANNTLIQYDTGGTATTLFPWKDALGNAAANPQHVQLVPFGGKLMIMRQLTQDGTEIWEYDGVGVSKVAELPANFVGWQMVESLGVLYVTGSFFRRNGSSNDQKPAVFFYQGGNLGLLWRAENYVTTGGSGGTINVHPGIAQFDGGIVFSDDSSGSYLFYNPVTGGVHTIGSYTVAGDSSVIASCILFFVNVRDQATGYFAPDPSTVATSGYVISSLVDFDSSLNKALRGVTVEFAAATDGDGGSVDISYRMDSVAGAFTSLATGVTSGTETTFPSNTKGHAVAIKITLNKGTSTAGPTLKSYSVRGAPIMPIYPRGEYILDCTNTDDVLRQLRDGNDHPLTGRDQVANLITARNSTTPISVTDKVNGTFTAFVDVNDPEGFDVYEIHPADTNPLKAGSYVVRLTVRGV